MQVDYIQYIRTDINYKELVFSQVCGESRGNDEERCNRVLTSRLELVEESQSKQQWLFSFFFFFIIKTSYKCLQSSRLARMLALEKMEHQLTSEKDHSFKIQDLHLPNSYLLHSILLSFSCSVAFQHQTSTQEGMVFLYYFSLFSFC